MRRNQKSMKINPILLLILCGTLLLGEGCSHRRSGRHGNRHHEDTGYEEGTRHQSGKYQISNVVNAEEIEDLAQTNDYNKMLKELDSAITHLKRIKKNYFDGKLSDKEFQEELEILKNSYQPILDKLSKANDAGELNYKQHKKQMAIFAAWYKEWESAVSKVLNDFAGELR